jgi:HD-GYP domain-containing protein (c-di-GMP phosphodiesterase class II)
MAVADSYDAARSRRFYKPPLPHAECCAAIYRRSGNYLDPVLVEAFRALEARFSSVADSLDE